MRSQSHPTRVRTVDLDHDQMLIIEDRPGTRIDVHFGGLWLTEERRLQDRFVSAQAPARLEAPGRAILQAIGHTRARIAEPARRLGAGWSRQWLRTAARLDVFAVRTAAVVLAVVLSIGLPELLGRGLLQGHPDAPAPHAKAPQSATAA